MSSLDNNEVVLSIIIPVYNVERYIDECLSSLLRQLPASAHEKIEIIIVNDGSTDSSGIIAQAYENKFECVKYYCKSNGGLSDARNYGIERSSAKYISFIDSDDLVSGEFIFAVLNIIEKNVFDILSFDFVKFFDGADTPTFSPFDESLVSFVNKEFYKTEAVFAWNKVYKRKLFANAAFAKGVYYEDVGLIPLLIDKSTVFIHCNQVLYGYRQRNSSITSCQDDKYLDILKGLKYLFQCSQSTFIKDIIITQFFTLCMLTLRLPLKKFKTNINIILEFYRVNFDISSFRPRNTLKHFPFRIFLNFGNCLILFLILARPLVKIHHIAKVLRSSSARDK